MFARCFCLEGGGPSEWWLSPPPIRQAVSPSVGFIFSACVGNFFVGPQPLNLCGGTSEGPAGGAQPGGGRTPACPCHQALRPGSSEGPAWVPPRGPGLNGSPQDPQLQVRCSNWEARGLVPSAPLRPGTPSRRPPSPQPRRGPFHPDVCLRRLNSCGHLPVFRMGGPLVPAAGEGVLLLSGGLQAICAVIAAPELAHVCGAPRPAHVWEGPPRAACQTPVSSPASGSLSQSLVGRGRSPAQHLGGSQSSPALAWPLCWRRACRTPVLPSPQIAALLPIREAGRRGQRGAGADAVAQGQLTRRPCARGGRWGAPSMSAQG